MKSSLIRGVAFGWSGFIRRETTVLMIVIRKKWRVLSITELSPLLCLVKIKKNSGTQIIGISTKTWATVSELMIELLVLLSILIPGVEK